MILACVQDTHDFLFNHAMTVITTMIRMKSKKVTTRRTHEIPSSRIRVTSTTKRTSGRIVQTTPTTRVAGTRIRSVLQNLRKRRPPSYNVSRMWRRLNLMTKTLKTIARPHSDKCGQLMPRPRSSQKKIQTPTQSYTPSQLCHFQTVHMMPCLHCLS